MFSDKKNICRSKSISFHLIYLFLYYISLSPVSRLNIQVFKAKEYECSDFLALAFGRCVKSQGSSTIH